MKLIISYSFSNIHYSFFSHGPKKTRSDIARFDSYFTGYTRSGILEAIYAAISNKFGTEMKIVELDIDLIRNLIDISDGLLSEFDLHVNEKLKKQIKSFKKAHLKRIKNV